MRVSVTSPVFPRLQRRFSQKMVNRYGRVNEDRNLIHYDAEAARSAGFSRPVVHGALVAALLSEACRDFFGSTWMDTGRFQVAFIKPVLVEQRVTTRAATLGSAPFEAGQRIALSVWCENEAGERVAVGEASAVWSER